uniref:citrate synthase (unknown stereospecificity) n=1 Tax=Brassica oleracea var. oleracea TaxID=109376 RepID=A0A0D3DU85_BRAOL
MAVKMERVNARLAVLSAHLEVSDPMPAAIKPWCTSSAGAPHGSLMGNLTIVDERTGKKYQVPVSEDGTVKSIDLKKITTGKDDKGLKLYDPGYFNTAPVRSSISYIDGGEGILRYRGYPIEELAENCTFLEVAYLLIYGNLPSQRQLADLEFEVSQHSAVPQGLLDIIQSMPQDAHPSGAFVSAAAMSALSLFYPEANPSHMGQDIYKSKQVRDKQIFRILGQAPTIAANAFLRTSGKPPVLPSSNFSYAENVLYLLDSVYEPSAINYFDAGEASGRRRRNLCQDFCLASCSSTSSARSTIFCSVSFLLCDSLGDKSQPRLSLAVRRRDLCFRFGVCVTRPVTLWGTPHRSAVPVNINHSDSLSHHVCNSGPMTVKYSTRVVATPQIPRSMSSRLDLPSASPTRSTAASAIPVTHASSSRYSCSEDLHRMPLLRPSQSLPSSIVSGILKSCVVGIPPFTRLSGLESRCLLSLSAPRSATTLFISKVYRFGSLLWVSEKISWVSTACSGEHPSPPFDVPISSPPISTFGVSPRYSPSPVKRMVVSNPRGLCYAIIVIPLFYEDCFGGYTVSAYGFNLFLYREEYFATMPPLYERRCFLGSITEALLQFTHRGVDVYAAISGAVGALYGPLHGGATDAVSKMLSEIGTVENIPDFIQCVKNKKRRLSGFGHRVYKNYDPRAKVVKKLAYEVFSIVGKDPLIEVAVALEKAALSDEYFVKRKLYPNVDFYSGLVYRAMGIPPQFIAVPRMAGYLAHWLESLDDPDTKIMRPQQVYTGVWLRHYAPVK